MSLTQQRQTTTTACYKQVKGKVKGRNQAHSTRTCSLQAVHAHTDSMHTAAACWLLCLEPYRTISKL